jgi:hypothetical protein
MLILIPAGLWPIRLMYKCLKKTSERFSFAVKDLKVGVLGIAGNHCTVDSEIMAFPAKLAFLESVS